METKISGLFRIHRFSVKSEWFSYTDLFFLAKNDFYRLRKKNSVPFQQMKIDTYAIQTVYRDTNAVQKMLRFIQKNMET